MSGATAGADGSQHPRRVIALPDADDDGRAPAVAGLEIVGELGRGPGTVVHHVRRDRADYVLKTFAAVSDPQATRRRLETFRREAARLAAVAHLGVPLVREAGMVGRRPYLVMDLVPGLPLAALLAGLTADGPLDPGLAQAVAADLTGLLAAVHRHGIVHGGVTPQNVVVDPTGTARLIDFPPAGQGDRAVHAGADLSAVGAVLLACHGRRSAVDETRAVDET